VRRYSHPLLVSDPGPRRPTPPLPVDRELPQLALILDGSRLATWLSDALSTPEIEARPRYIRYKPQNKAQILYDIALHDRWTSAVVTVAARRDLRKVLSNSEARSLVERARGRAAVPTPLMFLEDAQALIEWYPVNRLIPGLSADPSLLKQRLLERRRDLGEQREPAVLVYKPERRAVLRWGDCVVKTYARVPDFHRAIEGLSAAPAIPGVEAPSLVDRMPTERLTVQTLIAGDSLPDESQWRARLGEAIARVHRSALTHLAVTSEQEPEMARRTGAQLCLLLPGLGGRVRELLGKIDSATPGRDHLVPSHGDMHFDQALATESSIALLDFDHICMADPALDLATIAAHEIEQGGATLETARADLEDVLSGYGPCPPNLDWYLSVAILRVAAMPFRFLASDWPARVSRLIEDALTVLTA